MASFGASCLVRKLCLRRFAVKYRFPLLLSCSTGWAAAPIAKTEENRARWRLRFMESEIRHGSEGTRHDRADEREKEEKGKIYTFCPSSGAVSASATDEMG